MAFKVAEGFVEINVRYDRASLNRAAREAGDDAGKNFSDRFSQRMKSDMSRGGLFDKKFWSKQGSDAGESAGKAFSTSFRKHGVTQKLKVDIDRDSNVLSRSFARMGARASDSFGRSMQSGFRNWWNQSLDFTKGHLVILAGIVAAAAPAIGAALATGITLAFGAGIGAIGVILASSNEDVRKRYQDLWTNIIQDARSMTTPIQKAMLKVAGDIEGLWKHLRESTKFAFSEIAKTIENVTPRLVTGFKGWDGAIQVGTKAFRKLMEAIDWEGNVRKLGRAFQDLFQTVADDPEPFADLVDLLFSMATALIKVTDWLAETHVALTAKLGPAFDDFKANMGPAMDMFTHLADELGPRVIEAVEDILGAFGDSQDAKDAAGDVKEFNEAVSELMDGFDKADEKFRKFSEAWFGSADKIRETGQIDFPGAAAAREKIKPFMDGLKSGWESGIEDIKNSWKTGQIDFPGAAAAREKIKPFMDGLTSGWKSGVDNIKNGWNQFWSTGIRTSAIGTALSWIGQKTSQMSATVVKWFQNMTNSTINTVSGWWNGLVTRFNIIRTGTVSWVTSIRNSVVGWFNNIKNTVWATVSGWWNGLVTRFNIIRTGIVSRVTSIRNSVVGWFNNIRSTVWATVTSWWNGLVTRFNIIRTGIVSRVTSIRNSVVGWFNNIRSTVWATVTSWWNGLVTRFNIIRTGIVSRVTSIRNSVVGWFNNIKNTVWATVSGWWKGLATRFNTIRTGIVSRVKDIRNKVVGWFNSAKNTVLKTVDGFKSSAVSKFNSMKNSLIEKARSIRDNVKNAFNNLKEGAIKAFRGAKDGIKKVWDKVKAAAATPVKFMAHTVYNDGIVAMYRKIRSVVPSLPELKKIKLPKSFFATGGILPGYTPGRDVHTLPGPNGPVGLSGGEAIMRPEWTKAVGPDFVHSMNALARKRGSAGVREALSGGGLSKTARENQLKKATAMWDPAPTIGFAKGGILGKVNDFLGRSKDKLLEGFAKLSNPAIDSLTNGLKDRFGKGAIPNTPYHLMKTIGGHLKDLFTNNDTGGTGSAADVVRNARKSIGKYPESGGNNTNAITRWFGMNGAPWCAMYISWLFNKSGASNALKKAKRTAWTGDYYTSGMKRVAHAGRLPGDIAVYGTKHVNMVESKKTRIGGNQSNNVTRTGQMGGAIFRPDWSKAGGVGGGGNAVFTSFWDPTTASGKKMNSKTIASSYIPMGTKLKVSVGGKSQTGFVEDLGPAKFVYDRHKGKAVLDLNEIMMQKLTGRRSNTVNGSFKILSRGSGRTLYGTRWRGYNQGGIMSGSHDIGGVLPDKGMAYNRSGQAEVVHTLDQLKTIVAATQRTSDTIIIENVTIDASTIKDLNDVVAIIKNAKRTSRANGGRMR